MLVYSSSPRRFPFLPLIRNLVRPSQREREREQTATFPDSTIFVSPLMQDGSRQLELSLYLQYDFHVQQAVDEKMTTRCRLQTDKSTTTEPAAPPTSSSEPQRNSAIFSIDKSSRRNEAGPPATTIKNTVVLLRPLMNNSLTPTTSSGKLSGLPLTSYQGMHNHISKQRMMILWRARALQISFTFLSFSSFFFGCSEKTGNESRQ